MATGEEKATLTQVVNVLRKAFGKDGLAAYYSTRSLIRMKSWKAAGLPRKYAPFDDGPCFFDDNAEVGRALMLCELAGLAGATRRMVRTAARVVADAGGARVHVADDCSFQFAMAQ